MLIFGYRKNIDIIYIYARSDAFITELDLRKITNNLEENLVKLGGFNSHNRLWESHCINDDKNSTEIKYFTTNNCLTILNDGLDTRHDIYTNKFSAINLTLTNPALSITCQWRVHDNNLGSDH